ncbi:MAG: fibronectin type III domain-containing protein, partial [Anaerolineae bacterium]
FGVTWNGEPTWTPVDSTADVDSSLTWYEWDVTDVVTNWAQDVYPNDGLEIIGDEAIQERERAFYSRETTTDFYPQLVIDYTDTGDTLPPIVTVDALPTYSGRNFNVSWSGSDQGSAGINHYDVQVRVDGGNWTDWQVGTTNTSAEYVGAENGRFYEFRARGVDNVGNVEPFGGPEASTTADTMPPVTLVDPLPPIIHTNSVTVSWSGSDDVSGIQYYDVRWRVNDGDWSLWLTLTTATSYTATGLADGWYQFEARAVDNLDHVEPFTGQAEASVLVDTVPPFVEPAIWLPIVASGQ